MRRWITHHATYIIAGVTLLATGLTILSWAMPSSREWARDHGGLGWTAAAILFVTSVAMILSANAWVASSADEHASLRAELEELRRRAQPSKRDVDQFAELMAAWSWEDGLLPWLNYAFNARQWSSEDSAPLFRFESQWRERFFDDPVVQAEFERFFAAVSGLTRWMAINGSPDPYQNKYRDGQATIYSIADGNERQGGWPQMDAVRDEALNFVQQIFDLRRPLEEVGRRRGL